MAPSLPRLDAGNCVFPHAVVRSYQALQSIVCANSNDLFGCKFGRSAAFSAIRCAVLNAINLIVLRGVPAQIGKPVICWISVVVTALMSRWRLAYKRAQYESVNSTVFPDVVLPQKHIEMPALFASSGLFRPSLPYVSDVSKSRNGVGGAKAGNACPYFLFHMVTIPDTRLWCNR